MTSTTPKAPLLFFALAFQSVAFLAASVAQCANVFNSGAMLAEGRSSHSATVLANGKVLIAGGGLEGSNTTARAEIYDPQTDTFSPTFLPPYSPEPNRIEILWRFCKHYWLTPEAYQTPQTLLQHVTDLLRAIGTHEYQITFG